MKIKQLQITGYKNLNISITHQSDNIALIGNNGSGKSNVLEALSFIFKELYTGKKEKVLSAYSIEYILDNGQTVKIERSGRHTKCFVDDVDIGGIRVNILPRKIVAIYSGEEERLWKGCYKPLYDDFLKKLNNSRRRTPLGMPKMLYINKLYWNISLLTMLISDIDENKKFTKSMLNIDSVDKIRFTFKETYYNKYKNNPTLNLVKSIDSKNEYTLDEIKQVLANYIPDDIYQYLYFAYRPKASKIVEDVEIEFNGGQTVESMSEGEKKLLLLKSALEFAGQEDTLFIFDEPDAHVHINNKHQIIEMIKPYKHNRQVVITTHSPTLTKAIKNDHDDLYMLDAGSVIPKEEQEVIEDLTGEYWNTFEQNIFLASNKKLVLLVEGKHDKIHITNAFDKLKDEYPQLDFDIYPLGSESNIYPFMIGLYESNMNNDVTYIGIYDDDGAGRSTLKSKNKFEAEKDECGYQRLQAKHRYFYAMKLVKPEGFTTDCTIENMYEPSKYQDAYKAALSKILPSFANKSIKKISEDINESAKNILTENSKNFNKEDFKNFRPLFKRIVEIVKLDRS